MKKPGRPSLEESDREAILYMAELWSAGTGERSVRKISRICAGLEVTSSYEKPKYDIHADANTPKNKPSSVAKRLERRFHELIKKGEALPVSVYIVRNRNRLLLQDEPGEPPSVETEKEATQHTAHELGISEGEVAELAQRGWRILREWSPDIYHRPVMT